MPATVHPGLTRSDVGSIKDKSLRTALQKALTDGRISDREVDDIIDAAMGDVEAWNATTNVRRRLDPDEIKGLWLVADKARTLSATGRKKLTDFLEAHAASELMYQSKEKEGRAAPGVNFAGPGFRHTFAMRPADLFDFAGKIHDLAYQMNGVNLMGGDPKHRSRRAKADYIFRQMNAHAGVSGAGSGVYNRIAGVFFNGGDRTEFLAGDGFVNPLTNAPVMDKLNNPTKYLMIPHSVLPAGQRPEGAKKFYLIRPFDYKPGFVKWFEGRYATALPKLRIGSHTGPK